MTKYSCEPCNKEFKTEESLLMHNKAKHTQKFKQPLFTVKQKKRMKTIAIIFVILALITAFIVWRSIPPKNAPIIQITPDTHNFGTVSQRAGTVETMLTISNTGAKPLVLSSMETSCMCTSASIVKDEIEGPIFGMASHGNNPKNWNHVILPGESSQLKIAYNPNVHKDLRGAVTRSVYIYSNDPRHRKTEVKIRATQTD